MISDSEKTEFYKVCDSFRMFCELHDIYKDIFMNIEFDDGRVLTISLDSKDSMLLTERKDNFPEMGEFSFLADMDNGAVLNGFDFDNEVNNLGMILPEIDISYIFEKYLNKNGKEVVRIID